MWTMIPQGINLSPNYNKLPLFYPSRIHHSPLSNHLSRSGTSFSYLSINPVRFYQVPGKDDFFDLDVHGLTRVSMAVSEPFSPGHCFLVRFLPEISYGDIRSPDN